MPDALIRRATPADAEVLARLGETTFVETFVEGFRMDYPPDDLAEFVAQNYTAEAFSRILTDPEVAAWIAEDSSGGLAYATAGPNHLPHPDARRDHGELYRLYVARAAQGRRLGARMLQRALDWLEQTRPGPIWIGVWSGNEKAQRLYAHFGFEKAGEYDFPVGRTRDHEFILRRG